MIISASVKTTEEELFILGDEEFEKMRNSYLAMAAGGKILEEFKDHIEKKEGIDGKSTVHTLSLDVIPAKEKK